MNQLISFNGERKRKGVYCFFEKKYLLSSLLFLFFSLCRPEIALHKKGQKMEKSEYQYKRRSQRDYSYSFKLQVVREVERGELSLNEAKNKYGIQGNRTVSNWIEKYGNFDRAYELNRKKMKSPEQEIFELKQQLRLLERKNKSLEKEVEQSTKKAIFFDMMIDIAEEELNISIRKKSLSNQLIDSKQNKKGR